MGRERGRADPDPHPDPDPDPDRDRDRDRDPDPIRHPVPDVVSQAPSFRSQAADVVDVWTNRSGGVVWRLSASEVRQVLALRVDFAVDEVQRLRL